MPGLNLMGTIGAYSGPGTQVGSGATDASSAAFGPGYSGGGTSGSGAGALKPTHPMGIAFWGGAAAMGGLVFIRHSLPAERRQYFDMVLLMLVLWGPTKGVAKMSLQRLAQEPQTQGPIDKLARAGLWVLS